MPLRTAAAALLAALNVSCASAHPPSAPIAAGSLAQIEVIDGTTDQRLPIYWHQGKRWVAGTPGNRYAVALRNHTGGRVLAVVSVDGVNAVTGETAAWDQNGYVFAPGQRWEIRGWRKSQERVAAFEFTALPNSYAARTGRPQNVGVIGVALFREKPKPYEPPAQIERPRRSREEPLSQESSAGAAPATPGPSEQREAPAADSAGRTFERSRDKLGTGHGRSESSWVSYTDFERARSTPDEVITIHYDSRDNLIAMGVLPGPQPVPNPFPGSTGFVPDPR
jgi:hypothetical protein